MFPAVLIQCEKMNDVGLERSNREWNPSCVLTVCRGRVGEFPSLDLDTGDWLFRWQSI